MAEAARVVTTDAEIDLAIKHAKQYEKFDRKVIKAAFSKSADQLRLVLNDGVICTIPRRLIQGLAGARKKDLKPIQILGGGTGLLWPLLDVAHSVSALLTGVYGSARWMKELSVKLSSRKAAQMAPTAEGHHSNASGSTRSPVGIDSRHRDFAGSVREKSGNTLVATLRKTYGEDFLCGWQNDARLSAVRQETDMSLNEMVRQYRLGKRLPVPAA